MFVIIFKNASFVIFCFCLKVQIFYQKTKLTYRGVKKSAEWS
ncbi:hypothetical protein LEP1GSC103_2864 [Leptospira borgpetersenii serovar Javanica str. UI 09931]|uniref:Lipoprotein n=1 Tax=Leptospira borgpetersenii serovar Javanica str. UI 09931 TaxID=1049767 RepID=A0AAV3JDB5_LEPBO|nr:hypothetical protein LEP1GSC101_3209 [Leptospira borgpetersenii str. UI 09149]EMK12233.1 hypothetical protein LEP1GSC066_3976 [Leptospira sp. serovar Kenya str. Sh9]EMN59480.1 hypothetical protein LEP1GSC090_1390 [Leptospira borgpetersenii serovar Javanica str. MK146]EPG57449.1 hypothetical protein LEP1GSC103_2864 [Leptospira borgpetersenii serovar Javanica str. UI 09931]